MRIISKFKDYYDGLMDTSPDRLNKVWVRKEEEIRIPTFKLKHFKEKHFYWGYKVRLFYLVVAGKVYPVLRYSEDFTPGDNSQNLYDSYKYYYTVEEFDKDHPERTRSMFNSRHAKSGYSKNKILQHWKDFFSDYPDLTDMCLELNTPVFMIEYGKENFDCTTNVNLKKLQFFKVKDAYAVYQEIDMFVSNILINDEMPMSPMTDVEKIESHGFDKRSSFRNIK